MIPLNTAYYSLVKDSEIPVSISNDQINVLNKKQSENFNNIRHGKLHVYTCICVMSIKVVKEQK